MLYLLQIGYVHTVHVSVQAHVHNREVHVPFAFLVFFSCSYFICVYFICNFGVCCTCTCVCANFLFCFVFSLCLVFFSPLFINPAVLCCYNGCHLTPPTLCTTGPVLQKCLARNHICIYTVYIYISPISICYP